MNRLSLSLAASLTLSLVATAVSAGSVKTMPNGQSIYGSPATNTRDALTVNVGSTKALNVDCGDIVTFQNGDKRFSWKFEAVNHGVVDLQDVAPAGFSDQPLRIYVSRNEYEGN